LSKTLDKFIFGIILGDMFDMHDWMELLRNSCGYTSLLSP